MSDTTNVEILKTQEGFLKTLGKGSVTEGIKIAVMAHYQLENKDYKPHNAITVYLEECIVVTGEYHDKLTLTALYDDYVFNSTIDVQISNRKFRQTLQDYGLTYHINIGGNRRGFRGVKFK